MKCIYCNSNNIKFNVITNNYDCLCCGKSFSDLVYREYVPISGNKEPKVEELKKHQKKILLVEDGSVDIDELKKLGINFIVYRQGSKIPQLIELETETDEKL